MEAYIIDIQLESQPIDEVLTTNTELTLDLNTIINSDPLCEITLSDIELTSFIEDIDVNDDDDFSTNESDSDFLDDINFNFDIDDIFE